MTSKPPTLRNEIREAIAIKLFSKGYAYLAIDTRQCIDQATDAILAAFLARVPKGKNYFNRFKLSHKNDTRFTERDGAMFDQGINTAVEHMLRQIGEAE